MWPWPGPGRHPGSRGAPRRPAPGTLPAAAARPCRGGPWWRRSPGARARPPAAATCCPVSPPPARRPTPFARPPAAWRRGCASRRTSWRPPARRRSRRRGWQVPYERLTTNDQRLTSSRGPRARQCLAWEQRIPVGRVVREGRDDYGVLHQVLGLHPVVHVHVGVMGVRPVLHGVLDELEARQPYLVERHVVGGTGAANRQRGHAQVVEGLHPDGEHGPHGLVALQVDAPKG